MFTQCWPKWAMDHCGLGIECRHLVIIQPWTCDYTALDGQGSCHESFELQQPWECGLLYLREAVYPKPRCHLAGCQLPHLRTGRLCCADNLPTSNCFSVSGTLARDWKRPLYEFARCWFDGFALCYGWQDCCMVHFSAMPLSLPSVCDGCSTPWEFNMMLLMNKTSTNQLKILGNPDYGRGRLAQRSLLLILITPNSAHFSF